MWVAPDARRRGIARALLETVENWMIAGGGTTSTLSVTTEASPPERLTNPPVIRLQAGLSSLARLRG
jgi:GNAT superfamily N-acetyltransferase